MSLPKILAFTVVMLLVGIGVLLFLKEGHTPTPIASVQVKTTAPQEIELDPEVRSVAPTHQPAPAQTSPRPTLTLSSQSSLPPLPEEQPEADRIEEFFKEDSALPIVETLTYRSRVDWQKGRPAWLSDYASYYETSRHFIARSLRGKPAYFDQEIVEGDRFNVLRKDKAVNFYLLIDTSRCKMWFYAIDGSTNDRYLVKTYSIGLGRQDSARVSGLLTPLGKYTLGSKIAIYKPKVMGYHQGKKIEMITIFGTRWIPFDQEVACCTAPAKGFGIHGVPWIEDEKGVLKEDCGSLGKYQSDGCVRMATVDMEELFAIVITKPTIIELVKDYHEAQLPGKEKK